MRRDFDMRCGRCGRETDGFCQHCATLDRIVSPVTYWGMVSGQQHQFFRLFKALSHKLRAISPLQSFMLNMRAEHLRKKSITSSTKS